MPTASQVLPHDTAPAMLQGPDIDVLSSTNTFIVKRLPSPSSSGYMTPLSTIIQRKDEALRTLSDYFDLAGPGIHDSVPQAALATPSSIAIEQLVFQCADKTVLLCDPKSVEQLMERSAVIKEEVEFALARAPTDAANPVVGVFVLVPMHTTRDVCLFLDFCRIQYTPLPSPSPPDRKSVV